MYFESLKIFCDVVRHRSFSRAASANRITQSAASQNVLQLEKGLGVRLLDRSKRPFQLTPEGQVYFEGCKGLVERYYAVEAEVKTLSREVVGTTTVAAIYSVGLSDMSQLVQEFSRAYPKASVRLAYLHPDRVYESVINEEVDIGLVSFPKKHRGLIHTLWRKERMVAACSPQHRLAKSKEITPDDLKGEVLVGFDHDLTIRKEIDKYLKHHRVEMVTGPAFDNIETIKHAVEIHEGIAILPEPTLRKEVQAGTLIAIPLSQAELVRPLGIIRRKSGHLTPTTQKFIELMQSREHARVQDSSDSSECDTEEKTPRKQAEDDHAPAADDASSMKVTV